MSDVVPVTEPVLPVTEPVVSHTPSADTQPDKSGDKKAYTTAELNTMFADRAKRAEEAATKRLLEVLGVSDVDSAKNIIVAAKASEDAAKSTEQKLQDALVVAQKEAADAKAASAAVIQERQLEVRDNGIKAALTSAHCKNPSKVLTLISAEHPTELAAVVKDGALDSVVLKALVELGKKENPEYFTGGTPGSVSNAGGRPSGDLTPAEKRARSYTPRF